MSWHAPLHNNPLPSLWAMAAAPMQANALEQALELGLLPLLRQPLPADAVAQRLALAPKATALWLELLWSMGWLARHERAAQPGAPLYVASPQAQRWLTEGSGENIAQAWLFRMRFLRQFAAQWPALLRHGGNAPAAAPAPLTTWGEAARQHIAQEQQAITAPAALALLDTLPALPGRGHFLDLGGGPGWVAIALAQRLPGWQGTVCDQAEAVTVAQDNIQAAGLATRLRAQACDLNEDFPALAGEEGYGLIWCSALLHFLRDPLALLRQARAALRPGGLLLLAHAEQTRHAELAAQTLPFYGPLALRGQYLPQEGEIPRLMAQAGLTDIQTLGLAALPMAPVWVHAGRAPLS
ncbi:class I SAM-dependent methyltransferase [Vandammella animalimorsus]|uniref:O-methyltransferase dimerisation domain-containing protein n=1 Tax=Vandammella animalimorsus TaxID=2029117 RepID=A0A2A2AER5_9BURK|nr:class I SAM-dependent methyltransferase [Vandammella animalimorsus]PAT36221.1 hypothetical protein CK620_03190 [Vandammella animalimorsus]